MHQNIADTLVDGMLATCELSSIQESRRIKNSACIIIALFVHNWHTWIKKEKSKDRRTKITPVQKVRVSL